MSHRPEIDSLTDYIAVLERQADVLEKEARRVSLSRPRLVAERDRVVAEIRRAKEQRASLEAADEAAAA